MIRKILLACIALSLTVITASAADTAPARANLSAVDIANKNIAARGGLQAWRGVQSMSLQGKLGVGGNQRATVPTPLSDKKAAKLPTDPRPTEEVQLPFVMEMQRPHKMRFEIQFKGQTAVQIFDGANGWKLRPYLNRKEVEPYTAEELKAASLQAELDGHLVDYATKGSTIELEGMEKVEDRDTYKLKLTMKNGRAIHIWIDSKTFLETKVEGQPRRLDSIDHPVEIYYRDYRSIDGLQIPFVLETKVLPVISATARKREMPIPSEKITMEKVIVNPKLDALQFSKPQLETTPNTPQKSGI
jgi:outer membrane lipoprotein-sorting protein